MKPFMQWPGSPASPLRMVLGLLIGATALLIVWTIDRTARPPDRESVRGVLTYGLWDATNRDIPKTLAKGKWVLLYFASSSCTEACNGALNDLRAVLEMSGPTPRLQAVVLLNDGELNDGEVNPDRPRRFAQSVHPRIDVVTGHREDLAIAASMIAPNDTAATEPLNDTLPVNSKYFHLLDPDSRNIFVLPND